MYEDTNATLTFLKGMPTSKLQRLLVDGLTAADPRQIDPCIDALAIRGELPKVVDALERFEQFNLRLAATYTTGTCLYRHSRSWPLLGIIGKALMTAFEQFQDGQRTYFQYGIRSNFWYAMRVGSLLSRGFDPKNATEDDVKDEIARLPKTDAFDRFRPESDHDAILDVICITKATRDYVERFQKGKTPEDEMQLTVARVLKDWLIGHGIIGPAEWVPGDGYVDEQNPALSDQK